MTQLPEMKIEEIEKTIKSDKWREGLELYKEGKELDSFYSEVIAAFSMDIRADKLRNAMTNPHGRQSIYYALTHAAQTGLSVNPALKQSRLATYWDDRLKCFTVSLQVDKGGYIKMAKDAGCTVIADIVRENDQFDVSRKFDGDEFEFKPARKSRGEMDGAFCAIREPNGKVHVKYMTIEEINAHKDRYAQRDKKGNLLKIWADEKDGGSFLGMALKTVIKAALNSVNIGDSLDSLEKPISENTEILEGEPGNSLDQRTTEELMNEIKKRAKSESSETESDSNQAARF